MFSPDGRYLYSSSFDAMVHVWDLASGRNVRSLRGHTGDVACMVLSPDGRRLATAGFDGMVRLYDAGTGELKKAFVPVPLEKTK